MIYRSQHSILFKENIINHILLPLRRLGWTHSTVEESNSVKNLQENQPKVTNSANGLKLILDQPSQETSQASIALCSAEL